MDRAARVPGSVVRQDAMSSPSGAGAASKGEEDDEEGVAEAVSLDSLEGTAAPVALICNHVFHDGCIQQWLQQTRRSGFPPL